MKDFNTPLDQKIEKLMGNLPDEKVNPDTRSALLDRIEKYNRQKRNDTPFMSVFWKVGGAAIAAGIIALVIILPSYNKSDGATQNASINAGAVTASESELVPAEKSLREDSAYVATNRYSNTISNQSVSNFRP